MTQDNGHGPLVLFTSLAIAGAGAIAIAAGPWVDADAARVASLWGLAMLATGFVTSAWHLGRRDRAHFAVRGMFRSPISHEGALGALTAAAALIVAAGLLGSQTGSVIRLVAGGCALAFLVSVGLVYRIGGQLTWAGFSAFTPVTAGLAFGAILCASLPPPRAVSTIALACIALDAFTFSQRWRQIAQVSLEHETALGPAFDRRHELLAARLLLLDALPCISLFVWPTPLATVIAFSGIVIDRLGFYALALQHDTEAEIRRVESVMDRPE